MTNVASPYVPPTTLNLSSVAQPAMVVFGTHQPTVIACLDLWEREVGAQSLSTDERRVLPAIKRAIDRTYRTAATTLEEAFGRFCAYCELPVSEQLQVEHLMPKSQYPTFAVDPGNLLLACGPCNRLKSHSPTRRDAAPWVSYLANPTPADYQQAIRGSHYCWPDIDPSPSWLPLRFEYLDPVSATWIEVDPPEAAVDAGVARTTAPHVRPVRADIPRIGMADVEVRVRVTDGGPPTGSPSRAVEMIDLCGLNSTGSGTNDARVTHRTRAWLEAVALWRLEMTDPTSPPHSLTYGFKLAAAGLGCFSVWYTTGRLIEPSLGTLFVSEVAEWFPGTDLSRLP